MLSKFPWQEIIQIWKTKSFVSSNKCTRRKEVLRIQRKALLKGFVTVESKEFYLQNGVVITSGEWK